MTLILIKKRPEISMTRLMYLTLKWIYEEKTMLADEVRAMQEGFVFWSDYFKSVKDVNICKFCNGGRFRFGVPCIECQGKGYLMSMVEGNLHERLLEVAKLYQLNADGEFENRKKMFIEHKIDWKKFHRLPGSVTAEDRHKAQLALDEAKKANPEDYK